MREIDHAAAEILLRPAFDGELDAVSQMRFEAHMADCPICKAEYASLSTLRTAIREGASRHQAPGELRGALMRSLGQAEALPGNIIALPTRPVRRWASAAAGFALGAALAASVSVVVYNAGTEDTINGDIVAAHIRALQPGHLTDIQVTDQHQVKPWFDGKIDFAPPVKELADQGFDLVGGRLDYFAGRNAAVVVYRRRLHLIDLFISRTNSGNAAPHVAATPSGYNIVQWRQDGLNYEAVSDLNRDELTEFVRAWQHR